MAKILVFITFLLFVVSPQLAEAHASLIHSTPSPGSHLQTSPPEVRLTFNERLAKELYYIRVYNHDGKRVSDQKTKMSKDHTEIYVKLPHLSDGVYTVSYHIISADSHPVAHSYLITIGEGEKMGAVSAPSSHQHGSHLKESLLYGIYYFLFLGLAGWVLIGVLRPRVHTVGDRSWLKRLSVFFFIVSLLIGLMELKKSLQGFGLDHLSIFLFHSSTGLVALGRLFLATVGMFILWKSRWVDTVWFAALILLEAFSGHAAVFTPVVLTMGLDVVHLVAAAFWVGGVLYIVTHFRKMKGFVSDFLPFFTRGALISLLVLVVSGFASTLLFLPHLGAIVQSDWGDLLLWKIGITALVFLVAAIMHRRLHMVNPRSFSRWLKVDFVMLLVILMIVGGLTHTSPYPQNQPLSWVASTSGFQVTTQITPKNPGVVNTFRIQIKSQAKKVKNAHLVLAYQGKQKVAPLEVPLKSIGVGQQDGVKLYTYQAKGSYLMLPGEWKVEVRFLDGQDNAHVLDKEMSIYQVN